MNKLQIQLFWVKENNASIKICLKLAAAAVQRQDGGIFWKQETKTFKDKLVIQA